MIGKIRGLVVLVGLLAVITTVRAENPGPVPPAPPLWAPLAGAVPPPPPPGMASHSPYLSGSVPDRPPASGRARRLVGDDALIRELVSILNETRSPDAFLVTLAILKGLKADARLTVPTIIRNAERLRLFKRTDPHKPTAQQETIMECIEDLLDEREAGAPAEGAYEGETGSLSGGAMGAGAGALLSSVQSSLESDSAKDLLNCLSEHDPLHPQGLPAGATKPAVEVVVPGSNKPLSTCPASPK